MPSAETQTPWSWLQDLALISLYRDEKNGLLLNDVQGAGNEATSESQATSESLPHKNDDPYSSQVGRAETGSPLVEDPPPTPGIAELENLPFSSDSNDDGDRDLAKLPEISTQSVPVPVVLRYLRESEALTSRYFSLSAKKRKQRNLKNRHPPKGGADEPVVIQEPATLNSLPSERPAAVMVDCDFCGQRVPRLSLLSATMEERSIEITEFCCDQYKEYCIFVAACMRRMLNDKQQSKAENINIEIKTKKKLIKIQQTAQERALAMMRRKRKWEELKRQQAIRFLQSTSFHSLTKQTKTIEFSLLSPAIMKTDWMVRLPSAKPHNKDTSSSVNRMVQGKPPQHRSPNTIEGRGTTDTALQYSEAGLAIQAIMQREGPLNVQRYSNGSPFMIILPNLTGQCYYPSGRIAILIYSLYPDTLGYLVYEDNDFHNLLATLDEFGRATCYAQDGSIRLLLTPFEGMVFDSSRALRRRWNWMGGASSTLFQPLSLQLNRWIALRFNHQDNMTLCLSAANHYTKFAIGSTRKTPTIVKPGVEHDPVKDYLHDMKARISDILEKIQYTQKLQRVCAATH